MKISQPESPEQHGERQPSTDGVERTQAPRHHQHKAYSTKVCHIRVHKIQHVKYIRLLFNGLHSGLLAKYFYNLVKVEFLCSSII